MNRGMFHGSLVHQIMMNNTSNNSSMNTNMRPTSEQMFSLLPSSNLHPFMNNPWHPNLDSHESLTQILLGGVIGDEEKYMANKTMIENWQDLVLATHNNMGVGFISGHESDHKKIQQEPISNNIKGQWNQVLTTNSSSPTSCLNTSFSSNNMLDFSNNSKEKGHKQPEYSSECNSTATGAFKKARIQVNSSPQLSTFKRKEKLGDRITALHQLISPFGKTDTASVLLEAIGYIRFLHAQIQALSSPYLGTDSGNNLQPVSHQLRVTSSQWNDRDFSQNMALGDQMTCLFPEDHEQKESNDGVTKDLKSRGLCLVPVSFTFHVGSENGADFWAPMPFGGGFQ